MEEVWRLADRVTVLLRRTVSCRHAPSVPRSTQHEVVRMMVGRCKSLTSTRHEPRVRGVGRPPSAALHLRAGRTLGPLDLDLARGEVVAMAGLVGSGRTELARLIFGADYV